MTDNEIRSFGRVFSSAVGIFVRHAFGNTIAHNHVHDGFYTGISVGWVWGYGPSVTRDNRIEKNHIHDIGQGLLSDMGGIYTLGSQPGSVIRGNLIHDVRSAGYGGWGIYPDEGSTHVVIEDNVVYRTSSQAFHQHYGNENTVRNNVFAFGGQGMIALSRAPGHAGGKGRYSATFERNVIVSDGRPIYVAGTTDEAGRAESHPFVSDLNVIWDVSGAVPVSGNGQPGAADTPLADPPRPGGVARARLRPALGLRGPALPGPGPPGARPGRRVAGLRARLPADRPLRRGAPPAGRAGGVGGPSPGAERLSGPSGSSRSARPRGRLASWKGVAPCPSFATSTPVVLGADDTRYRLLTKDHVSVGSFEGEEILKVAPEALTLLAREAFREIAFFYRERHLEQVAAILDDPEASENDRGVALALLRNAEIASKGQLPMCQDTGTATIVAKKGQRVWTGARDEEALARGVYETYHKENLRYSQTLPLSMYEEKNSGTNLPAQIDIHAVGGDRYDFLFVAKGGGSANKSFLFQETKALLNPARLEAFMAEKMRTLGTAACPPYHLVFVIGGTSAETTLKTVKLASTGYLDHLPTKGNDLGPGLPRSRPSRRRRSRWPGRRASAPSSAGSTSPST